MRKRNHVIPVRLNTKELRFLEEQVEKSGLSREEYIRSIVMGGEVRARPCEHHTELLRKVSGLCNNANQLAHVANGCGMAGEENIREMLRMTKETWRLVKILREQGVDEETIQKLREYDWDDFNAERRFWEHQTSLLDCMELLLEEKETKESQPESVEALLDTEEYTEAYY